MGTDDATSLNPLLGLTLPEALSRFGASGPAPLVVRAAPPRPRTPLPEDDAAWRVARIDAGSPPTWVVVPSIPLPAV